MPRWWQIIILGLAVGLTGCTPVQIGLGVGKLCTSLIRSAVRHQELQQARLEQERLERAWHPEDFLDIGDPFAKARARLGPPREHEEKAGGAVYFFPRQRIVTDSGRVVEKDLKVAVDGQKKITEIMILEPTPPGAGEGQLPETGKDGRQARLFRRRFADQEAITSNTASLATDAPGS